MSGATLSLIVRLATSAFAIMFIAGCERLSEGTASRVARRSTPVARVEVVRPERHTVRRSVGEPGQLQAFETTAIHAKIPGYVKQWTVNIGDRVKKGQVLAELLVPEMEADLRQRQAMVAQAVAKRNQVGAAIKVAEANVANAEAKLAEERAGIARAEADVTRWKSEHGRVEQLFVARAQTGSLLDETRNKLRSAEATLEEVRPQVRTAQVAVIQALAALDQTHSDLSAADAAIEVAREDVRHAEALMRYTRIEAPFNGIVTQRNVNTGDLTQPGADRPPLFVIARSDILTIRLDVPEVFATTVNPGDRAAVELQAIKGRALEGKVTRISWALDPRMRTLRVEIDIPNPDAKLQPGLYAYATIVADEHAGVMTLPVTAIVSEQGIDYCVVVVAGKAMRRPIKVGLSDGTRIEVVSGLAESEAVVKANAASLADGQPVEIMAPAKAK